MAGCDSPTYETGATNGSTDDTSGPGDAHPGGVVELGELHQGRTDLAAGLDGGTSAQLSACPRPSKACLRGAHKEFLAAGVTDVVNAIS